MEVALCESCVVWELLFVGVAFCGSCLVWEVALWRSCGVRELQCVRVAVCVGVAACGS